MLDLAAIKKRILQRAAQLGIKPAELQEHANVGVKFIAELDGKFGPQLGKLYSVKRELGSVTWDWLIDGVGDSPTSEARQHHFDGGNHVAHIPERDIRIAAGGGQIVDQEEIRRTWGLPQSFLYSLSLKAESLEFVEIVGNSMYPLLWPGDLVLIDRRSRNPDHRAVYALWDGDATVCKWVERDRAAKAPTYLLTSENAAENPPYRRRADDAKIVGRVVWFGRRL